MISLALAESFYTEELDMVNMKAVYEGQLHCTITHGPSGNVIVTDAPVDNQGKGEAFSPTDLVGAALGSCMLTVMGIVARRHDIKMEGSTVQVVKEMVTTPQRRIGSLSLRISMAAGIPQDKRSMLEAAAHACPVHKSLHPDVHIPIEFIWNE